MKHHFSFIHSFIHSSFIHSFITEIYIAPLQGYYSEALPTFPRVRRVLSFTSPPLKKCMPLIIEVPPRASDFLQLRSITSLLFYTITSSHLANLANTIFVY